MGILLKITGFDESEWQERGKWSETGVSGSERETRKWLADRQANEDDPEALRGCKLEQENHSKTTRSNITVVRQQSDGVWIETWGRCSAG